MDDRGGPDGPRGDQSQKRSLTAEGEIQEEEQEEEDRRKKQIRIK